MPSAAASYCKRLATIFSTSLPIVFRSTMGWNALGVLYAGFPGFGMTTVREVLNYSGHMPATRQALATQRRTSATLSFLTRILRCHHVR